LVNELLDVSRIAAGKLPMTPEEVDLAALAKEVGRAPERRGQGRQRGDRARTRGGDRAVGSHARLDQ